MFDIGFAELLIIGVVGLLVIGPERLPGTIRTVSAWLARLRRGFNEIKQEVKQELHNDEVMRELREAGEQIKQDTDAIARDISTTGDSIRREAEDLTAGLTEDLSRGIDDEDGVQPSPPANPPTANDAQGDGEPKPAP